MTPLALLCLVLVGAAQHATVRIDGREQLARQQKMAEALKEVEKELRDDNQPFSTDVIQQDLAAQRAMK